MDTTVAFGRQGKAGESGTPSLFGAVTPKARPGAPYSAVLGDGQGQPPP